MASTTAHSKGPSTPFGREMHPAIHIILGFLNGLASAVLVLKPLRQTPDPAEALYSLAVRPFEQIYDRLAQDKFWILPPPTCSHPGGRDEPRCPLVKAAQQRHCSCAIARQTSSSGKLIRLSCLVGPKTSRLRHHLEARFYCHIIFYARRASSKISAALCLARPVTVCVLEATSDKRHNLLDYFASITEAEPRQQPVLQRWIQMTCCL